MTLQQILSQLPTLKPTQLIQIKTRVDFLLQDTPAAATTPAQDWLVAGLCHELQRRGLTRAATIRAPDKVFLADAQSASTILLAGVRRELTLPGKLLLGQIAARALADYLTVAGVPLGLKVVMKNVGKVPFAFDASFPGYLEAGMVGMLISPAEKG